MKGVLLGEELTFHRWEEQDFSSEHCPHANYLETKAMKPKPLTYLLALTLLFLFSGSSVVFGNDFTDGADAFEKGDFQTAYRLWLPLAEQGDAKAQYNLGRMYYLGQGVPQDYVLAHMWWNLAGSNGQKKAVGNRNIVEKKMTPSQIEEAQRLARNWKPTKK